MFINAIFNIYDSTLSTIGIATYRYNIIFTSNATKAKCYRIIPRCTSVRT